MKIRLKYEKKLDPQHLKVLSDIYRAYDSVKHKLPDNAEIDVDLDKHTIKMKKAGHLYEALRQKG